MGLPGLSQYKARILNGHEQDVKNIMVMEQLDRFNTFIITYPMISLTETPFWTLTCP